MHLLIKNHNRMIGGSISNCIHLKLGRHAVSLILFLLVALSATAGAGWMDSEVPVGRRVLSSTENEMDMANRELKGRQVGTVFHNHHNKVPSPPPPPAPIPTPIQIIPVPIIAPVVDTVQQRRRLSCPAGFDLVSERCVTNEVISPDFTCPPDTQLSEGRCIQSIRPRRDCPDGYQVSGSQCVAVDVLPVQFSCPEGVLDETGRGCKVARAAELRCPTGFTITQGEGSSSSEICVQKFAAQVECPVGYTYHKKGCVRDVSLEAAPMCPAGSELDPSGNKCFTMKHSPPKCPKGFKVSRSGTACLKHVKKILAGCPAGFESKSHHEFCERVVESPPQLSCPAGSSLDPISGQCTIEISSTVVCPHGFSQSVSVANMCESVVEEVGTCPPGSAPVGVGSLLRCQSVIEHEIIECCPPGFEMSSITRRCERREVFRAVPACEECARVRTLTPSFSCPEGFELDRSSGGHCIRRIVQSCDIENDPVEPLMPLCDEVVHPDAAYFYGSSGGAAATSGASLRSLYGGGGASRQACRQQDQHAIETGHQKRMCSTDEVIPAEVYCPAGEFDGVNCVQRIALDTELKCANGSSLDPISGQCLRITNVPIKTECLPGTTRIGNRCVEYQDHAPQFSCPPEATVDNYGNCVIRAAALKSAPEILRSNPIPVCVTGTLSDRMCYDVERVPRQPVCPEGAVAQPDSHDFCMLLADFIISPPVRKYSKPKFFCGDGSPARGKSCHSHDRVSPVATCPTGSSPDPASNGRLCIRSISPVTLQQSALSVVAVPICPPGSVVQGTKCVISRQIDSKIICPPGYFVEGIGFNASCVRAASQVPICPAGTLQTVDGCLRQRSVAPTVEFVPVNDCHEPSCY